MKAHPAVLLPLAAAIGLAAAPISGQEATYEGRPLITARRVHTAPAVDGLLSSGEWEAAVPVHVAFSDPKNQPGIVSLDDSGDFKPYLQSPESNDDLSFDIRALYDSENLYLSVDVRDEAVHDDSPAAWADDCVEVFFNGDLVTHGLQPSKEYFQILCDVGGDMDGWNVNPDWSAAAEGHSTGYTVEFRLSLGSIDVTEGAVDTPPSPGDHIGLNIAVNDDDNGGTPYNNKGNGAVDDPVVDGYVMWSGQGNNWDQQQWGRLYLDPEPGPTAVQPSTWGTVKAEVGE